MSHIHWIGTGLSAIPGIKKLIQNGHQITVWNRTVITAEQALKDCEVTVREFSIPCLLYTFDAADDSLRVELHFPRLPNKNKET